MTRGNNDNDNSVKEVTDLFIASSNSNSRAKAAKVILLTSSLILGTKVAIIPLAIPAYSSTSS